MQVITVDDKPTNTFKIGVAECVECRAKSLNGYACMTMKYYMRVVKSWKLPHKADAYRCELYVKRKCKRLYGKHPFGSEFFYSTKGAMLAYARKALACGGVEQ